MGFVTRAAATHSTGSRLGLFTSAPFFHAAADRQLARARSAQSFRDAFLNRLASITASFAVRTSEALGFTPEVLTNKLLALSQSPFGPESPWSSPSSQKLSPNGGAEIGNWIWSCLKLH